MQYSDVIVVGGGVIGASAAYYLAAEGLSVTLFERAELASEASGAAAGMLAPICELEGDDALFDLGVRSLELFPELAPRLRELSGIDPQYCPGGILRAALSADEAGQLQDRAQRLASYGLEWLSADAALEREPHLSPEVLGALWSPREGHVYSPRLARAYAYAAVRLGARLQLGTPVTGLIRDGDRVLGIRTASGEWGAGHVVLCGGVWTRFCAEWVGERLPLEPVRGQILALETPQPAPRSIVWSEDVYLVPKMNGSIVVGATEEHVGFDCRTTVAGVSQLLAGAVRVLPALAHSAFRLAWAGLRPDTTDHLPAIGAIRGVDNLSVAAGHYRNGVLLSPVSGQILAAWIKNHEVPAYARPFLPDRVLK